MSILHLSNTRLSTFRECREKYYYKYVMKREPIPTSRALAVGRLWHEGLEAFWKYLMFKQEEDKFIFQSDYTGPAIDNAFTAMRIAIRTHAKEGGVEDVDAAKLIALMASYWPPLEGIKKILGVEIKIDSKVPRLEHARAARGIRVFGYLDALVLGIDGKKTIIEHKTTSRDISPGGEYWKSLTINTQPLLYCGAVGATRVLYDVVRIPMLRVSAADKKGNEKEADQIAAFTRRVVGAVASDKKKYFQFQYIYVPYAQIDHAREEFYQQAQEIKRLHAGKLPVYRNQNSCRSLYGWCPFLAVCAGEMDIMDDANFQDKQNRQPEEKGGKTCETASSIAPSPHLSTPTLSG